MAVTASMRVRVTVMEMFKMTVESVMVATLIRIVQAFVMVILL